MFAIFAAAFLMTSGLMISCGGGGSSNSNNNNGTVFVLPDGVKATVDGDSYDCYTSYNSNCMNYSCSLSCYEDFYDAVEALDPNDANYTNDYNALYATYQDCDEACYAGCDMTSSFVITITLTNTTTQTITVTLPAGLTFVPSDSGYQPMMIITEITITISDSQTVTKCLPVFCLALSLHAPDEEAVFTDYNIVTSTGAGCLSHIMDILADVNFSGVSYYDYQDIQDVIWSCTESGSISPDEEAFLNSLPKAKKAVKNSNSLKKTQKRCPSCMLKKLDLIK